MENNDTQNLSKDIVNQISGYMRTGADYNLAVAACGIDIDVADFWLNKAIDTNKKKLKKEQINEDEEVYLFLYRQIRTASAQAEVIALQRLAAEGGASGAKWLLDKITEKKQIGQICSQQPKDNKDTKKENFEKKSKLHSLLNL